MVERFDRGGVVLADGSRIKPDAVIAATGYRTGLEPMVGHLGVLDERGEPRVPVAEAAPGLRFIGDIPRPGQIGRMGQEARAAADEICGPERLAAPRTPPPHRARAGTVASRLTRRPTPDVAAATYA